MLKLIGTPNFGYQEDKNEPWLHTSRSKRNLTGNLCLKMNRHNYIYKYVIMHVIFHVFPIDLQE